MSWRDFQDSIPNDKIDKIDKTPLSGGPEPYFVDIVDFVYRGTGQKKQDETTDPFLAGHHVLVHLDPVGDVWLASDEQAAGTLQAEGVPVLLEKDIRWIMQVQGHETRLERLKAIFGKRHPLAKAVLDTFPGARVGTIKLTEV